MSDDAIVQAVISRLLGEQWYQDARSKPSEVRGLPYVVEDISSGSMRNVTAKGERVSAYNVEPLESGFVRCAKPTFPLSPDVWDYETNHWRGKS